MGMEFGLETEYFWMEREQMVQLVSALNVDKPQQVAQDKAIWLAEEGGVYFVKSTYEVFYLSISLAYNLALEIIW